MIDFYAEELITLPQAARLLPARRKGRPAHTSCVYRWALHGCQGVVLETIQVGGTLMTSREALARFFDALTRRRGCRVDLVANVPRNTDRCASERAGESLKKEGL